MTMTWRWIPSSRPVSVVSDLLPLRRQAHEEISASNSPLSSMSLWPGLIGLMWKLRILWSGGFAMRLTTLSSLRWPLTCSVAQQ
ncbi:pH-response regulator protein palC [Fusarium oxysporum f. sp. albedinis]|nr:hypothetical protein HZ326_29376 [Fusarium oxysporum f. sp. albedinis]KAJ0132473.1 pH-response regulator protein palC [Fusarium oxysporum f. sp. albedinis]